MRKQWMMLLAMFFIPGIAFAAAGNFHIANDTLFFPDGTSLTTAPRDGKSVLNGSGPPIIVANPGDFYIDTANNLLYGPYEGGWGTGVSLVGPQGTKGDPGAQGAQGAQGIQGVQGIKGDTGAQGPAGTSPFTVNNGSATYNGPLSIGTTSPAASKAILDVTSTTLGFLPPRMTTAQRNAITSPPAGLMIYNTTTKTLNFYNGTAWDGVAIIQQDLLGQISGTTSFNSGPYYYTGYQALHTGTISSVNMYVNSTGTFKLLIMNAARTTLRNSTNVTVNTTGLVTVTFAPVTINAGEYIGFYYTGTTTFSSAGGTAYYGATDPPGTLSSNTNLNILATVNY